ncbi:hypothetical protein Taro_052631 [Colocasia esculenta]|uniref:Uncharacterized protein n=1 Tax=Colocasia esculenta TaxID=4460 RepID=A0A843XJ42_COLES|nr:hypothetical protein [Colocasia esculenta]
MRRGILSRFNVKGLQGPLGRRGEALTDKHTLVLTIFQCGTKEYLYTAPPVRIRVCWSHEDEMLG